VDSTTASRAAPAGTIRHHPERPLILPGGGCGASAVAARAAGEENDRDARRLRDAAGPTVERGGGVMGFLDKAKAAAEQAAAKAKEEYDDLQLRRAIGQATTDLGKATFELIEQGELAHESLEEPAAKLRQLRERAAAAAEPDAAEPEPAEPLEPPE
jgi:hypothetical protein